MKVLVRTYGCRANQYDSELIRELLAGAAIEEADNAEEATFAIFNSCSVTAAAEAELRKDVRRVAGENPRVRSIITGCAPGGADSASLAALPSVVRLIAGSQPERIAETLGIDAAMSKGTTAQSGARALLRVQEGCDEHCTYCIARVARGANRSRPADELIHEALRLADSHPEIVITGLHVAGYGRDCGTTLGELIAALLKKVPNVRFRLSSIEPTEADDTIVDLFTSRAENLAPFLHAPLQSGSDTLLRRMGRHWYSAASYRAAVGRMLGKSAVFGLSADVICGFPGETHQDHAATVELIRSLPFTGLHVFVFSERPGTAAARLWAPVTHRLAHARARELRTLAQDMRIAYERGRAGGTADVVAVSDRDGLTEDYISVRLASGTRRKERFAARLTAGPDGLIATRAYTQSIAPHR